VAREIGGDGPDPLDDIPFSLAAIFLPLILILADILF
jgi:hypothetical protein